MAALIAHLESQLGPIQDGARLREGIQGVRFRDCPNRGAMSFMTLGLSSHILTQRSGVRIRIELVMACQSAFVQLFNPLSALADACDQILRDHSAPARGMVFGPNGRLFKDSEMEALYCASPVYFPDQLCKFNGFAEPFVPIWLVPITGPEAELVRVNGWNSFEELLEQVDPDLLDLIPRSLTDHDT